MSWTGIAYIYTVIFWNCYWFIFLEFIKNQRTQKVTIDRESKKEMDQLRKMR